MNEDSLFASMIKMEAYNSVKLVQTLYEIVLFNADIMTDAFVNVFTNICQSVDIMQRIRNECENINELVDYRQIDGLSFLTCVINESARLNPGIVQTFAETITQPMDLGGFQCPANTLISLDTQMLNRDPDVWTHPHEFNPDRFSGTDSKQFYQYHRFGLGPRMCLGNIYADYILKSIVVLVLNKFDLTFVKRKSENTRISLPNMSGSNLDGNLIFGLRK
jgi:cytochrome P450